MYYESTPWQHATALKFFIIWFVLEAEIIFGGMNGENAKRQHDTNNCTQCVLQADIGTLFL